MCNWNTMFFHLFKFINNGYKNKRPPILKILLCILQIWKEIRCNVIVGYIYYSKLILFCFFFNQQCQHNWQFSKTKLKVFRSPSCLSSYSVISLTVFKMEYIISSMNWEIETHQRVPQHQSLQASMLGKFDPFCPQSTKRYS